MKQIVNGKVSYFATSKMNTTNSSNSTEDHMWESSVPPALQFAFGVIGNAIALVVLILSSKDHQWRPFYRLVFGLALTDGGGILCVYPTVMIRYASNFTFEFPKSLCDYSSFIYTFTLMSSAMIICAMSFDRFFAILFPILYNNSTNKGRRTNCVLAVIWSIGLLLSTLHLMGLGSSHNYYPKSWCFLNFVGRSPRDRINSYIYSVFGLLVLICTIAVNISVILTVCRNRRSNNKWSKRRLHSDVYIIIFLLVIVIVFTTCWAPLMVVIFSHATSLMGSSDGDGPLELLVLRFAVNNSIVDPWIYILLRKETLNGLKSLKRGVGIRLGIINESFHNNNTGRSSEKARRKCQTKVTDTGSTVTVEKSGGSVSRLSALV
ncbi:prostaglandin E2 receptor EP4 subtype-like [Ostrea edulis]|uniref:prostaglandin E2 receptor EP4 subtype-like n=1 Tax=Ostrea edulis TaxID=37623 RepID=UPI0020958F28|nr:prostaglandin E2 receptor EP4 subtype-like [Ostrea edulis]